MVAWLCGAVLGLSILLGGGTHAGFLGDTAVQILSVPLLAVSLWPALKPEQSSPGKARLVLVSCCAVIFVLGVQLLPLPFDAWPGGASLVARTAELPLVFVDRTWPPLSLSPQATWAAAASLSSLPLFSSPGFNLICGTGLLSLGFCSRLGRLPCCLVSFR